MNYELCNVLFPGGFKPVHAGHITLMQKYLDPATGGSDYNTQLTIIISKSPREGISAETTKWFLSQVFAGNLNVKIMIAPDPSPIKTVYDMVGTDALGTGLYAMGTSAKGSDITRAEEIVKKFAPGGKYETPGVKVIFFPINPEPLIYVGRKDQYNGTPISSTVVRQDIRNNDYESFKTAYRVLLDIEAEGLPVINEAVLKEYFEKLKAEILPLAKQTLNSSLTEEVNEHFENPLFEGGAAGHMDHPYDIPEFTFAELKKLIYDLFAGNITDVTEKLDGQNLFASVDEHGNTIFARNSTTLKETPWYLGDIMNNPKWSGNPSVQHAFTNAALTIDKVFKNIPKSKFGKTPAEFFNRDDKADGIRYRWWLNLEILDTENFNVIPYVESKISFHGFKAVAFNYADKGDFSTDKNPWEVIDVEDKENSLGHTERKEVLQKAIDKTNRTVFKVQITPNVILQKVENGTARADKYCTAIDNILDRVNLDDSVTIGEYKETILSRLFANSKELSWLDNEVLEALFDRWIYDIKDMKITDIAKNCELSTGELMTKEQYNLLRDFEKNRLQDTMKSAMKPLDTLFIKLGNEILKSVQGITNAGREKEVIKTLNKEFEEIRKGIAASDDPAAKRKLEQTLSRLAIVNNELNATEGIVFKYNGRVLKLTGAFAPANQILGCGFKKFKENNK